MSIKGFEVGGVQAKYDYESLDNIPANLVQDANYVHTDNNFTNADKTKLSGIEAQANKTTIDATLTHSGQAADAKATGDAISALNAQVIASMPHDTASGSIANFPDGAAMPVRDLSVDIEPVQAGSGDPSPDNVRPISGWTECKVTRTGKNLCDSAAFESGLLATAIGSDINAVTSATRYAHSGIMPAKSALAVTVKTLDLSKIDYASIVAYVGDKVAWTAAQSFSSSVMSKTWTIPANTYEKLRINIGAPAGVTADASNAEIQVEIGSATAYEAYQGETYTIDLNGTRYGGTLDVTSGKLTVTKRHILISDYEWSYSSNFFYINPTGADKAKGSGSIICSAYPTAGSNEKRIVLMGTGVIRIYDPDYTTPSDFVTAMGSQQIVYELATPIVIDNLDPVTVETLLGTNNIFADCGDTTVDYYADTTLFVNKKIAAAVAALS